MTKILLVANTDWYLYNFRRSLARFLTSEGFEVGLVSPPGNYAKLLQEAGFRWMGWEVGRQTLSPAGEISSLLRLARIYRQELPDLVHHHTIKCVLYGSLAARLTKIPVRINSITGRGYVFVSSDRKAAFLRLLVKPFYKLAFGDKAGGAAIFENAADLAYFVDHGLVASNNTFLIEGVGVDADEFVPTPEPEGPVVVLLAARMLWDKGVGALIEAMRILRQQGVTPDRLRAVLVGEPDPGNPTSIDQATLKGWHDQGIADWWGWRADMKAVYAACHIVTLPTTYGEGVPTTLLEAAACGKPIVATDIPGCREIIRHGDNGLLIPPGNHQALAEALLTLVEQPAQRGRMGQAGRQIVLQRFTNRSVNVATLDVYCKYLKLAKDSSRD